MDAESKQTFWIHHSPSVWNMRAKVKMNKNRSLEKQVLTPLCFELSGPCAVYEYDMTHLIKLVLTEYRYQRSTKYCPINVHSAY